MAKHRINPAPGAATGWGKYLSGQEYELSDEQAEKFRKRGIIGEPKYEPKAAPKNAVDAPTGGVTTHIGPKHQPQPEPRSKRGDDKNK